MKSCLASVNPFVFTVYESFVSSSVARTGKAIMPLPRDRIAGGQTVCAVGYDRTHSRFI